MHVSDLYERRNRKVLSWVLKYDRVGRFADWQKMNSKRKER